MNEQPARELPQHGRGHGRGLGDHRLAFLAATRAGPARPGAAHLKLLDGDYGGFPVDRLQHSLQTATRAHRGGESEDYVVMALAPRHRRHARAATTIPTSPRRSSSPSSTRSCTGCAEHHGIFQGYYFFHYLGLDRDMREAVPRPCAFRGHGPLLRALRPDRVRPSLRQRAARLLRADGPARFRGTETVDLRQRDRRIGLPENLIVRVRTLPPRRPCCLPPAKCRPGPAAASRAGRSAGDRADPRHARRGRRPQLRQAARSAGPPCRARPRRRFRREAHRRDRDARHRPQARTPRRSSSTTRAWRSRQSPTATGKPLPLQGRRQRSRSSARRWPSTLRPTTRKRIVISYKIGARRRRAAMADARADRRQEASLSVQPGPGDR